MFLEFNLIEDLSCLTGVRQNLLNDLVTCTNSIISHDIVETIMNKEKVTIVNIGIGYLYFTNEDNIIKYKFVPSEKLEKVIVSSYKKKNELSVKIEDSLSRKISECYKELF